MNRIPITSSNSSSVGYDQSTSTLEVEFKHGGIYQYFDVPASRYAGLMSAYSHSSYFDIHIKNGVCVPADQVTFQVEPRSSLLGCNMRSLLVSTLRRDQTGCTGRVEFPAGMPMAPRQPKEVV